MNGIDNIPGARTRFDRMTRIQARAALAIVVFSIFACLLASRAGKPVTRLNVSGYTDPEVLQHIVNRVRGGATYYQAAGGELRADGFHVRSVFNWRQPLYAWLLALLPMPVIGQLLLASTAIVMTLMGVRFSLAARNRLGAILIFCLIPGACYGGFMSWGPTTLEISAGILIAISVFAYAGSFWLIGLLLALMGLFVRELTAPYVAVCLAIALFYKRWSELGAWIVGLLFYGVYFALHVSRVHSSILPTDVPDPTSWIQFGGLHFVLTTASQHVLLFGPPLWVTAIYLPIALLGITALPGATGTRITCTVGLYIAFFTIAGKSFNDYWGFVYSPLLALGFAWSPLALARLRRRASASAFITEV